MEEVMEEVMEESTAGGGAGLLMECEEEEEEEEEDEERQDVWPQSSERDREGDEEEEGHDEAPQADPAPAAIGPPEHNATGKSAGAPLTFKVNGWLVSLLPGGGGTELKLRSRPGGSASGFTSVQIQSPPAAPPAAPPPAAPPAAAPPAAPPAAAPPAAPPGPEAEPTPVITGVVSGEAAQRVLSNNSVTFRPGPPLTGPRSPPVRGFARTPTPPRTGSPSLRTKSSIRRAEGPESPPDCPVCRSQYKLITELRGFMCLCSPALAQSLKNLKRRRKIHRRRSRGRSRTSRSPRGLQTWTKGSRTRPGLSFAAGPVSPPHAPPRGPRSAPPTSPPSGKLVIMVEDFYYGSAPGRHITTATAAARRFTGPYRCTQCGSTARNNLELMSHMQLHASSMSQDDGCLDAMTTCPHCFRHFLSPFTLQRHLEAVHSQNECTAQCRICELDFSSEPVFLCHMKSTHKPGEMPYTCQVCDFRSSFYSDVWSHFQQLHGDTNQLMCQFCLRVLRSSSCYQLHYSRHQKKQVFSCDKCRLHFLYVKDRMEHKLLHHRTHVRPPQLTGLRPGTKVTVRTYSVVGGSDGGPRRPAPCKVVDVATPAARKEARRRPVESLGPLLVGLSQDSEAPGAPPPPRRCVECVSSFQDFRSHFPSVVGCSLCSFTTCCSTAYANHMINNHATCRKKPQYPSMFQSELRLSHRLMCVSCTFSTFKGDAMANHLTERPDHRAALHNEPRVNGSCVSVTPPAGRGGGAFIPIHLLPSGQTSPQLSVKALTSPSPLSSPPAMTIRFVGPRRTPEQPALSASQLAAVLCALCHGVAQAARRHRTPPPTVQSWIELQRRRLPDRKWHWKTEKVAEWVLSQREQQLRVSEDELLQTARKALGRVGEPSERYSWAADFLLRHELGLQPAAGQRGRLPCTVRENSLAFISALSTQIHSQRVPPHCVASMDEFSIFTDLDWISDQDRSDQDRSDQDRSALRFFGSSGDRPSLDVVLSACSDGTLLPPLLFFGGPASPLPDGFPDNVLLEARQEGFSDQDRLHMWINKVWRPRVASRCDGQRVLMVDVHRGHLSSEFRSRLTSEATDVVFIPSGCSSRLQPLDVCVTPVLRDFLQVRWTQLLSQGGLDGLGLDQLALTLACWFSEVSSTLNSEADVLRRSFALACDPKSLEGQGEAARMIQALRETLVQSLDSPEAPPPDPDLGPGPDLELLLVMEEEQVQQEVKKEESKSPSGAYDAGSNKDPLP